MQRFSWLIWAALTVVAVASVGTLALHRGETISAMPGNCKLRSGVSSQAL